MEIKEFTVTGAKVQFVNEFRGTRSGFAHDTTLFINGYKCATATCHYLNRTWERYTYQSVMRKVVCELRERRREWLKEAFKAEKGYKKLTAERKVEFNTYVNKDADFDLYRRILNEL